MQQQPPKWADRLLEFFCKPELLEEIQGDLHELYSKRINKNKLSQIIYFWYVIRFIRISNIRSIHLPFINLSLVRLNFKAGYRNLRKARSFSIINIIGLSLSLCASLFIFQHVHQQKSFDKFHSNSEKIYRISSSRYLNGELQYSRAMTLPEVGLAMEEFYPEIKETARIFPASKNIEPVFNTRTKNGKKISFSIPNAFIADSSFLTIFDMQFITGDPQSALSGSNKIILSEKVALKFFGHTDIVGLELSSNLQENWIITGVYKDLPANSHFKPDVLLSWFNVYGDRSLFTWDGFYTYILLNNENDITEINSRLNLFKDHYLGEYLKDKPLIDYQFGLQPLEKIHLHSKLENEFHPTGHKYLIDILIVIGILILLIAVVNQINLNTSRTLERTKEIGIRKVIGSSKASLMGQFLIESLLINLISLLFALLLIYKFSPQFNTFFGTKIDFKLFTSPEFWMYLFLILSSVSLLTAFYPLLTISGFKLSNALKGIKPTEGEAYIKKGLVTFQFAISLILIICTLGIFYQLEFLQNKDLGFDVRKKLILKLLPGVGEEVDSTFNNRLNVLKKKLNTYSYIDGSTVSSNIPGRTNEWLGRSKLKGQDLLISAYLTRVDENFIDTYNLKLIAGKNFPLYSDSLQYIIVNNAAVQAFNLKRPEDLIGQKLVMGTEMEIIGVVESFNEQSLHKEVAPSFYWTRGGYKKFLTINLTGNDLPKQVIAIEKMWKDIFPDRPFQFFFLDDLYNEQYKTELYTSRIITIFSILAVVIACMGLFAMASYTLFRKTKEIGIRKVFGANVTSLTTSFALKFSLPLVFASIVAIPISYWLLDKWLQQFAYRMTIKPELFALPFFILLFISLVVILFQTANAAGKNPIDSLRSE
ncbi:MAG: FtsX-like permease family protein [Candidatus Cyclobacteriaceae bacterium M2_1C_046]